MSLDVIVIVPCESETGYMADPIFRQSLLAGSYGPMTAAFHELEDYVGRSLSLSNRRGRPTFDGEPWPSPPRFGGTDPLISYRAHAASRSLSSVTLATHLERAGLRWHVIDPGNQGLRYWRRRLTGARSDDPVCVAICSTFITSEAWLRTLCAIVRDALPQSKVLLGGYYYAMNTKKFLSLDADVFCVGEGEVRLPQIVKALKGQSSLEVIPGLYIRETAGKLRYTGRAEQLSMETLPFVNWSLSGRIEPPINLETTQISTWVETQRGCVFKCEFCNYRTIALPNVMSPEKAARAILAAGVAPLGSVRITDATATFPHARWREILEHLIAQGGSSVPIWCFTRVSDIHAESAALMREAGVRHVFVGQESGDQRILSAMKKGTSVEQVKPAVQELYRNGINATFSFIHGFPGEDLTSLSATRSMLASLNDGFESRPAVLLYNLAPLCLQDFASVSGREEMSGAEHMVGYKGASFTPEQAIEATMETIIQISKIPHAPVFVHLPGTMIDVWDDFFYFSPRRYEIFKWLKAVERGTTIFLESKINGKKLPDTELSQVRKDILARYEPLSYLRANMEKFLIKGQKRVMQRLVHEWSEEHIRGPGLLTRGIMGACAALDTGNLSGGLEALKTGTYPSWSTSATNVEEVAAALLEETLGQEQDVRRKVAARGLRAASS